MSLNPAAAFSATTFTPDQLIWGDADDLLSEKVTLITPENRTRGAVLGRIATAATVAAAVADAGNTGNGTVTLAGTPFGANVKPGRYRLVCIEPAANAGVFAVEDPDGNVVLGRATVAVAFVGPIAFTINDGAADFISGDSFSIDVSAITYKYKLAAAAAVDGSAVPVAVLAQDADATAADVDAMVFYRGSFNDTQLTLGAGLTVAGIREALRLRGIYLVHGQPA
jgi:hypothetical protein